MFVDVKVFIKVVGLICILLLSGDNMFVYNFEIVKNIIVIFFKKLRFIV